MDKVSFEEALKLLEDCLKDNDCHKFFMQYEDLIKKVSCDLTKKFYVECDEDKIEELYHEVVDEVLKNDRKVLADYDPKKKVQVSTYLFTIAHHTVFNILKKERRKYIKEDDLENTKMEEKINNSLEYRTNINYEIDEEKVIDAYHSCLDNLTVQEKLVYKLGVEQEKNAEFIAMLLRKKKENIFTIKSRSLAKVKECVFQMLDIL